MGPGLDTLYLFENLAFATLFLEKDTFLGMQIAHYYQMACALFVFQRDCKIPENGLVFCSSSEFPTENCPDLETTSSALT